MKIFISQSNYIPWKGYFDAVNKADIFVLYDNMQYTRSDWRNRNLIKTPSGPQWLTIPVQVKGKFRQQICETEVADQFWRKKHWLSITQNYLRSPYFIEYRDIFEKLYLSGTEQRLSEINFVFLRTIADILGIKTKFIWSSEFNMQGDKTGKLVNICKELNATHYISGPSARSYLEEGQFAEQGIRVEWLNYSGYKEYPQQFGSFDHAVSILDLLFNTGPAARSFMNSFV